MLDSPQSQQNITKIYVNQILHNHKKILQKFKYVRQPLDTREYYKNLRKLDRPYRKDNITKIKENQIVHNHKIILQRFK